MTGATHDGIPRGSRASRGRAGDRRPVEIAHVDGRTARRARSHGLSGEWSPGARRPSGRRGAQRCRSRNFAPDALWRGDSALAIYFKHAPEAPSDEQVADWRREIWNQGFALLLWVVSPQRIDIYNGFGRPLDTGDTNTHRLRWFRKNARALDELDAFAGRLAMETGRFWEQADAVNRRTSVDSQLLSDLAVLERNLVKAGRTALKLKD